MVLKDEDIGSKGNSYSSPGEEVVLDSVEEEIRPCEGELLVVRRLLESQLIVLLPSQHKNLFQTQCKI